MGKWHDLTKVSSCPILRYTRRAWYTIVPTVSKQFKPTDENDRQTLHTVRTGLESRMLGHSESRKGQNVRRVLP